MEQIMASEVYIKSPLTGKNETLQQTLDDLFGVLTKKEAAGELDKQGLQTLTIDQKNATAAARDCFGKINLRRDVLCPAQTKHCRCN